MKVEWLGCWMVDWLKSWMVVWLIGWIVGWLIGWIVGWLGFWMVDWLNNWMVGCWMVDGWIVGWLGWVAGLFGMTHLKAERRCYNKLVGWMVGFDFLEQVEEGRLGGVAGRPASSRSFWLAILLHLYINSRLHLQVTIYNELKGFNEWIRDLQCSGY